MAVNINGLRTLYADAVEEPVRGLEHEASASLIRPELEELFVLDHIYRLSTIQLPATEQSPARQIVDVARHRYNADIDGPLQRNPVDLNWVLSVQGHNESPIVWLGDIYKFKPLASGPVMTMVRNGHRWDASTMVIPKREVLMEKLQELGFPKPWLIYSQTRLFPANPRLPKKAIANVDGVFSWGALGHEVEGLINALLNEEEVENIPYQMMKDLEACGKRYRYLLLDIPKAAYHRTVIGRIANFINFCFFEFGIVLIRKMDLAQGEEDTYQGTHGELYHDLKLMVDRCAPFSEGQFSTGWAAYLKGNMPQLFKAEKAPQPGIQRVQVTTRERVAEV